MYKKELHALQVYENSSGELTGVVKTARSSFDTSPNREHYVHIHSTKRKLTQWIVSKKTSEIQKQVAVKLHCVKTCDMGCEFVVSQFISRIGTWSIFSIIYMQNHSWSNHVGISSHHQLCAIHYSLLSNVEYEVDYKLARRVRQIIKKECQISVLCVKFPFSFVNDALLSHEKLKTCHHSTVQTCTLQWCSNGSILHAVPNVDLLSAVRTTKVMKESKRKGAISAPCTGSRSRWANLSLEIVLSNYVAGHSRIVWTVQTIVEIRTTSFQASSKVIFMLKLDSSVTKKRLG